MSFNLLEAAVQIPLTKDLLNRVDNFQCGDKDLDDFFHNDALLYEKEFLGKSYCWLSKEGLEILAIVTLSYNGIHLERVNNPSRNSFQRKIPNNKRRLSYPAVLIGRLGVNSKFQGLGMNIGSQIIDFLKLWFISSSNKAACRFLIVDAYNNENTLGFYQKNGFRFVYKTIEDEKESYGIPVEEELKSRVLYFDLKSL